MARKTITAVDPKLHAALDDFKSVSEVKYELARDAYDLQDRETQAAIDRIVGTLQASATGYISLKVGRTMHNVKIDNEYLGFNLLYLAIEVVKDLAFLDIRVANFVFPPSLCVKCGADLGIPEKRNAKGKARG